MSNVRVPQGFWATLTVVFALLFLLLLAKGIIIAALIAIIAAVFTGLETAGRGPIPSA